VQAWRVMRYNWPCGDGQGERKENILSTRADLATRARGLVRLTRWKEYVPFVIPVTLLGVNLALSRTGGAPDLRFLAVLLANNLAVAYAFMVNDIEDAPDDARDPARAARNPVTCGEISPTTGWLCAAMVAVLTLLLYAACGARPLAVGLLTLILAHLYSWKPMRLKAWPALDVISHSLMLSALLALSGYMTYHPEPGAAWLLVLAAFLGSAYGQLYNQLRDYAMDKAAGLHNTAVVAGERATRWLMYSALGGTVLCMVLALAVGVVPLWLAGVAMLTLPTVLFLLRPKMDMRGGQAAEISGNVQIQMLAALNVVCLTWLVGVVLGLA
jgi:4-hydroxybenzoate polyprenyltransferase